DLLPREPAFDAPVRRAAPAPRPPVAVRAKRRATGPEDYELPPLTILAEPRKGAVKAMSQDAIDQNARLLEGVLEDFGVKGRIVATRPGPVVTLYELEPAPGVKSSRVIGLADDIARSMSAVSARVAVVQGRNAIGIELPNQRRETVYLRELLSAQDFEETKQKLAIALGKTIGGEPVVVDLARMPHLLVAGTTGSGKSVAINTFVCSLLYRLRPDQCRLIMVDPKMLELSVYDGIPHLLTPVVTDPKKAVVALKWAVREMEDRYRKMSKLGVRNVDGFNARVADAAAAGETLSRTVQTGFDADTGEAVYEREEIAAEPMPYIVVVVDEMADLMMVAGKDIEGAIQRLAQMARAAGIHLIMATQRPSVDVITGTIKANFPTRISFQVTSKIDSRTILGEQGAEQLLGQGDMLYMAGGGRIGRVHGPFVSDDEVEKIVAHLKTQGQPAYLEEITRDEEDEEAQDDDDGDAPLGDPGSMDAEERGDLYDRAVAIVLRDRRVSTSYVQRRLSVGYNKAASLIERMEREGVVSRPSHSGKREILVGGGIDRGAFEPAAEVE
ncbi:MAG: DNA translocase FtsK, partial [Hyphomicrobiales bacterium]|nr:DNA translocase FtsK [Hyphomicrobiales bacterium]